MSGSFRMCTVLHHLLQLWCVRPTPSSLYRLPINSETIISLSKRIIRIETWSIARPPRGEKAAQKSWTQVYLSARIGTRTQDFGVYVADTDHLCSLYNTVNMMK
jgi:hypothetical protein